MLSYKTRKCDKFVFIDLLKAFYTFLQYCFCKSNRLPHAYGFKYRHCYSSGDGLKKRHNTSSIKKDRPHSTTRDATSIFSNTSDKNYYAGLKKRDGNTSSINTDKPFSTTRGATSIFSNASNTNYDANSASTGNSAFIASLKENGCDIASIRMVSIEEVTKIKSKILNYDDDDDSEFQKPANDTNSIDKPHS